MNYLQIFKNNQSNIYANEVYDKDDETIIEISLSDLWRNRKDNFENGINYALDLDIPVLFMHWSANLISTRKDGHILHLLPEISKQDKWYTEKELYDYWLSHIYKP